MPAVREQTDHTDATSEGRVPSPPAPVTEHASQTKPEAVSVADLTVRYGRRRRPGFTALSGVSIDVEPGSLLTLLGPSGSGKTTLLRTIAGLIPATSGRIRLGDRTVFDGHDLVPTRDRGLGMVFQSFALWPHMSVRKNVAYPLRILGWKSAARNARVDEVLGLVGLREQADRAPAELSGGQQQRVGLARAIAHQPGVLLMDEPLSNLDAQLREEMRLLIKTLQDERSHTTIYVTHDRTEALALSDAIIVLRDGEIVAQGSPSELFSNPQNAFTARFLSDWNEVGPADVLPAAVRERAEASRSHACTCSGHCVAMLPRTATMLTGRHVDAALASGDAFPAVAFAQEFIGDRVQIGVRMAGFDTVVRILIDGPAGAIGAAAGSEVAISTAEIRVLCSA